MSIVSVPRRLYRLSKVAFVFGYSIVEVIIQRPATRAARAAWLSNIGKRLLRATNVTCETHGPIPMSGAVISNHLTYVDIVLHGALRPGVFVSKIELRSTPVLGWISLMAGTVYVARGSGGSAAKAAEGMAKGFRDGLPVTFFPEGTTGVGDVPVLPLRSGLLAQAIAAEVPVHYGFIRYQLSERDLARGKTVRDDVNWGSQTLLQHIWNFIDLHHVHGIITFAPEPLTFSPEAVADRKVAAREAQAALEALARATDPAPVATAS